MKTAREAMTSPVITVTPTTPITEVARTLLDNEISGCPVVDIGGTLRGIISRANLMDHALSVEGGALTPMVRYLVPGGDEMEEDEAFAPLAEEDYEVPDAQDLMTQDVVTVAPETPLHEAAAIMSGERIHRVPVLEDGRVVGIITSLDLLKAFPRPS